MRSVFYSSLILGTSLLVKNFSHPFKLDSISGMKSYTLMSGSSILIICAIDYISLICLKAYSVPPILLAFAVSSLVFLTFSSIKITSSRRLLFKSSLRSS